jgi:SHS2 domain-containing protein
MSSLNTFGAVMSHAIQLENNLCALYQKAGQTDRAKDAEKRKSKLERVRRENVLEITLEPIEGLHEADYILNVEDTSAEGQRSAESIAARFYAEAAPKINVLQARRALERFAQEHDTLAKEN